MILAVIITILVFMILITMIMMAGASSSNGIFPHWSLLCCLHLSEPYEDGHDDDGHHKHLFNDALNHDDDDDDDDYGDDDDDDDDDDDYDNDVDVDIDDDDDDDDGDDDDDDVDDDDSHQVGLPSTGITVFGSQLHTHGTGRKVGHHHTDHHCWS